MKEIKLSNNKGIVLVDDEDYDTLNKFKWSLSFNRYAVRGIKNNKKTKIIKMHKFLMIAPRGMEIDHIDRNGLNNQKSNLRIVTHQQNMFNRNKNINGSSNFKGVNWNKTAKKWQARITLNKKEYYLGVFRIEKEAAIAYNNKAKELFGKYANLNNIEEDK